MKASCSVIVFFTLILFSCKKHVIQPVNQLSLLPPATQTGANTFGCLRDGLAFIPKNGPQVPFGEYLTCFYVNNSLNIEALADPGNGWLTRLSIITQSVPIRQGGSYSFQNVAPGNNFAIDDLSYNNYSSGTTYETRSSSSGTVTITKLDTTKHIVSGTFNFNAIDNFADTIKITNGRFDLQYNQ